MPDQLKEEGRYSYDGLDRVLHEKARLGIMTSLVSHPDGLIFRELKEMCTLSDGNLSRHLQILEKAGLVEIWKRFIKRRPQTLCRISEKGREAFYNYLSELERILEDARTVREEEKKKSSSGNMAINGFFPA
jgi:DNA-binding MarR family transcriptional regulator